MAPSTTTNTRRSQTQAKQGGQASIKMHRKGSSAYKCAVAEAQGLRDSHEDAHSMVCAGRECDLWVLDGHRGASSAHWSAGALAHEIGQATKKEKLPSDARIQQSFKTVDNQLRKYLKECTKEKKSGTTVIGALIVQQGDTYAAKLVNCGDSRGIIIRGVSEECENSEEVVGGPIKLLETVDHKPEDPAERLRIEQAGGTVSSGKCGKCPRIDSRLAVSRGLGDFEFKADRSKSASEQKVSCIPDIYSVSGLTPGTLIILACDGFWGVISSKVAASIVHDRLVRDPDADIGDIAVELVHLSLRLGSTDNVTVLVTQLTDGASWAAAQEAPVDILCETSPTLVGVPALWNSRLMAGSLGGS